MKKFNFKLEPLLNHRRFVEDAQQQALAHVKKQVSAARHIEKCLESEHRQLAKELKEKMQDPQPASESALYATYLASLSNRIDKQRQRIQEAAKKKDKQKSALLEAVKNRKIIERLKEVRTDRFEQFCLKKEQEFSDEIGIQLHNRKAIRKNGTE